MATDAAKAAAARREAAREEARNILNLLEASQSKRRDQRPRADTSATASAAIRSDRANTTGTTNSSKPDEQDGRKPQQAPDDVAKASAHSSGAREVDAPLRTWTTTTTDRTPHKAYGDAKKTSELPIGAKEMHVPETQPYTGAVMMTDKVRLLFRKFDVDSDGRLNYTELRALQLETSGEEMDGPQFSAICKALRCDPRRGLTLESLRAAYHTEDAEIDDELLQEHNTSTSSHVEISEPQNTYASCRKSQPPATMTMADKVRLLFQRFDADFDGLLNYAELRALQLEASGEEMDGPQFCAVCEGLRCDPRRGLTLEALRAAYESGDANIDEDIAKVFGGNVTKSESVENGQGAAGQQESNRTTEVTMASQSTLTLSDLPTPAFVVNRCAFVENCKKVRDEAAKRGIYRLRPHVKTHKTLEGAYIQANCSVDPSKEQVSEEGQAEASVTVTGFVASTMPEIAMLMEASVKFGGGPFQDVLYAIPISEPKLEQIDKMRKDSGNSIHLMLDQPAQITMIETFVSDGRNKSKAPFTAFLKLDTGYHRAGISCDERGVKLAARILASDALQLKGIYSHCGHAYDTDDQSKLDGIAKADLSKMCEFLDALKQYACSSGSSIDEQRIDLLDVSIGSTPSLFHHSNEDNALERLEIHPGNYTFYDRQQLFSGAAKDESDLAGRVLSRVIGHYEDRNTIMLDAGALSLTKDTSLQGGVCAISGHSTDLECYKMSQEVTLVRPADPSKTFPFDEFPLGTLVTLLPNHSCLAAACFDKYHVIDDESCLFAPGEKIVGEWVPAKGW